MLCACEHSPWAEDQDASDDDDAKNKEAMPNVWGWLADLPEDTPDEELPSKVAWIPLRGERDGDERTSLS